MQGDRLTFERDSDDGIVWFITQSPAGHCVKEPLWPRGGFGVDEIREAVLATGWISRDGNILRLTSGMTTADLRDKIDAILGYFDSPGVASRELLEVRTAADEYESVQQVAADIPLYAYAWLDLMVREDLAEEARSLDSVWDHPKAEIRIDKFCDRRVEELSARYSQRKAEVSVRMAESIPTRSSARERDSRIG